MIPVDPKRLNEAAPAVSNRGEAAWEKQRAVFRLRGDLLASACADEEADKQWFVLRVTKRDENGVDKILALAGIETWLPMKVSLRCIGHTVRKRAVTVPVMPGYLFVRLVSRARVWAGIRAVEGVIAVVSGEGRPLPAIDAEVAQFRASCGAGLMDEVPERKAVRRPQPGETVRLRSGSMIGYSGRVTGRKSSRVDRVWVELFGGVAPVELPLALLSEPE